MSEIKWKESGLAQEAPNGTKVSVCESEDGEAYFVHLDTPGHGDQSVTTFAITGGTLATMMVLIAKMGGLFVPGIGTVKIENEREAA